MNLQVLEPSAETENARLTHHLSNRGACNLAHRDVWGPRETSMGNPWSPDNTDGTVILRLAENSLMHDEIADFIRTQTQVLPTSHFTYSTGPRGSRRLQQAAAEFFNENFQPRDGVTSEHISVTSGLASAIDALAWAVCDEGEAIMIPQPLYNGFCVDILNRSNARIVGVSYEQIQGYSSLDDLFHPDVNRKALEAALLQAKADGVTVRALLISNPHNPLGRCYPPETLAEFASFCGRNQLHFISDEIYAKSVFTNPAMLNPVPFTSALALDTSNVIDPTMVHIMYGASKDFCANGLRLGLVCTRNRGIRGAISSISIFSWSPHIIQDIWAAMFENKAWLEDFMSKKTALMMENYHAAASFFRENGIKYYEMNAGLFIWVDLRHLLLPQSPTERFTYTALRTWLPDAAVYKERELRICEICQKNGVIIAPGHVYMPEEYGWFRVTFTLERRALEEGLGRLKKSWEEVELENVDWQ